AGGGPQASAALRRRRFLKTRSLALGAAIAAALAGCQLIAQLTDREVGSTGGKPDAGLPDGSAVVGPGGMIGTGGRTPGAGGSEPSAAGGAAGSMHSEGDGQAPPLGGSSEAAAEEAGHGRDDAGIASCTA